MAVTATPTFVQTPKLGVVQIVNADASNSKTIITAGANGSKVVSVVVASDDTSARILQLSVTRSATVYIIGSYSVPAASGTDGTTAAVDLLKGGPSTLIPGLPVDNSGQRYLFLQSGDTLTVKSTTTVTSGKTIHLTSVYGDF